MGYIVTVPEAYSEERIGRDLRVRNVPTTRMQSYPILFEPRVGVKVYGVLVGNAVWFEVGGQLRLATEIEASRDILGSVKVEEMLLETGPVAEVRRTWAEWPYYEAHDADGRIHILRIGAKGFKVNGMDGNGLMFGPGSRFGLLSDFEVIVSYAPLISLIGMAEK